MSGVSDRARVLHGAFAKVRARGFDWERRNCGLGAASVAAALLRRDLAAPYRERCSSALGAMRLLREKGGFVGLMEEVGLEEIPPMMASRGDVLLFAWEVRGRRREALGVCLDYRGAFPGLVDMELIPLGRCERAWRLPHPAH